MKHSLINPNQVRYKGLDFWDNPLRDNNLFMEVTKILNVPLKFKGKKCIFESRVPTKEELDTCPHFEMTSSQPWEPNEIDMNSIKRISSVKVATLHRQTFKVATGIDSVKEIENI